MSKGEGHECFTNISCRIWYHKRWFDKSYDYCCSGVWCGPWAFFIFDFSNRIRFRGGIWKWWSELMVFCRIIELVMESKYILKIILGCDFEDLLLILIHWGYYINLDIQYMIPIKSIKLEPSQISYFLSTDMYRLSFTICISISSLI